MMKRFTLIFLCLTGFVWLRATAQFPGAAQVKDKVVISYTDTTHLSFLHDASIYTDGWARLPQVVFWRDVLNLTADTCIINVAASRTPVDKVARGNWMQLSDSEKKYIKDSLVCVNNLTENSTLFVTSGKNEFYELRKMLPEISKAVHVFEKNAVDPWYAQTILLIESPGKNRQKSSVGANGPFQLMKSVARRYGLVVSTHRDDRTNLEKSARAASRLLSEVCIPNVKKTLAELNLRYNETDLWFRLLVLHTYHAGSGNVRCVLNKMQPKEGGTKLFTQLWQTECAAFKNESQNYSQIALANIANFDELIEADGDTVFLVTGDRLFSRYNMKSYRGNMPEAFQYLSKSLAAYENDLADGTIPYSYFTKRVALIKKEMKLLANRKPTPATQPFTPLPNDLISLTVQSYPSSASQLLSLSSRLLNKQRNEDAIALLKIALEMSADSAAAYDLLARAYKQSGNKQLAAVYANRSTAIRIMTSGFGNPR